MIFGSRSVMKPGDDPFELRTVQDALLSNIRGCLLASIDVAKDFGHGHPEYAAAVTRFSEEIGRIKEELLSSFQKGSVSSSVDDIVEQLRIAKWAVPLIAEHRP